MNNDTPKSAFLYVLFLTLIALVLVTYTALIFNWANTELLPAIIFLILIIISDLFPVRLPKGGNVSVSFAAIVASILLFQPFVIIIITAARDLFLLIKNKNRIKYLFNASQLAISAGSASLIYHSISNDPSRFTAISIPAFIASITVFFLLNMIFVTLILSFTQRQSPLSIWMVNIKWSSLTSLSMAPLGALIAVIYINIGFWGLVLFLLPLIIARHSFQSYIDMREAFLGTIKSLSLAIDAKDPYTKGHSSRVADYVVLLARELKWPEDKVEFLHYISMIHDVGKVTVPEHILKKDTGLTKEEYDIMKQHSRAGADIIKDVNYFAQGSDIIKYHHERWDGRGYPESLRGEEIPEEARILAVADAFDAMTSNRPYRKAMSPKDALKELHYCSGSQFDPRIVKAFDQVYPNIFLEEKEKKKPMESIVENTLNQA